mmetsp:Transcript_47360/g.112472  ORF Transcript_47360/g.112472 Transcript_47360/m.112472 type:complete len:171 (+) Transcript_47360:299-811(+)
MIARAREWASVTIFQPARQMDCLQLGVALASGLWGGLLPIPGITTAVVGALLAILALAVKVSAPMVGLAVAVNMALTLPDIVLVPVFIAGGARFLDAAGVHASCDVQSIAATVAEHGALSALRTSATCFAGAVLFWLALAPLAYALTIGAVFAVRRSPVAASASKGATKE